MKLLILDRDGVINQDSDDYIRSLDEWVPIPGSIEAIAALSRGGWTVAVATNQSGIGRGYYGVDVVESMHAHLRELVEASGGALGMVAVCPHRPDEGCDCRKPRPGLLQQIGKYYGVNLQTVSFVGDTLRDVCAALAAGCRPILLRTGKGERTLAAGGLPENMAVFDNLSCVADWILGE